MGKYIYFRIQDGVTNGGLKDFGTSHWSESLEEKPLKFILNGCLVKFFIKKGDRPFLGYIDVIPDTYVVLRLEKSKISPTTKLPHVNEKTAKILFGFYKKAVEKIFFLFYSSGLFPYTGYFNPDYDNLIRGGGLLSQGGIQYSLDGKSYLPLMIDRKKSKIKNSNPVYKDENLLNGKKWETIKKLPYKNKDFHENILKLYKLSGDIKRSSWNRFSCLEASILLEILLSKVVISHFKKLGFGVKKIKKLERDLSFYQVINIFLPDILGKRLYKKFQDDLSKLDILRVIRNDIVHDNVEKIDQIRSLEGIHAGIKVYKYFST